MSVQAVVLFGLGAVAAAGKGQGSGDEPRSSAAIMSAAVEPAAQAETATALVRRRLAAFAACRDEAEARIGKKAEVTWRITKTLGADGNNRTEVNRVDGVADNVMMGCVGLVLTEIPFAPGTQVVDVVVHLGPQAKSK